MAAKIELPAVWAGLTTLAQVLRTVEREIDRSGRRTVRTITASENLPNTASTLLVNATGGAVTATLPPADLSAGLRITVKKIDASGNAVTVASADTIDGAASLNITTQWQARTLESDGAAWFTV